MNTNTSLNTIIVFYLLIYFYYYNVNRYIKLYILTFLEIKFQIV